MLKGEEQGSVGQRSSLQRARIDFQEQAVIFKIIVNVACAVGRSKFWTAAQLNRRGDFSIRRLDDGRAIACTIECEHARCCGITSEPACNKLERKPQHELQLAWRAGSRIPGSGVVVTAVKFTDESMKPKSPGTVRFAEFCPRA